MASVLIAVRSCFVSDTNLFTPFSALSRVVNTTPRIFPLGIPKQTAAFLQAFSNALQYKQMSPQTEVPKNLGGRRTTSTSSNTNTISTFSSTVIPPQRDTTLPLVVGTTSTL